MKRMNAKRMAVFAMMVAMSLILFMVENLLPPLWVPGAKPGLGNIFGLLCLVLCSWQEGLLLVILRTVLGCLLVGNPSSLLYGLTAGVMAIAVETLLFKTVYPRISLICVSVVGSFVHATVQNLVFCLVCGNFYALSYLPYLQFISLPCGVLVGAVCYLLLHKVPLSLYRNIFFATEKEGK